MIHTTWYVLEDGSEADPDDVAPDDKGVLRHKGGVAVAMRESGVPRTSGARDANATPFRDMTTAELMADREMKPTPGGQGYRTRGTFELTKKGAKR